MFCVDCSMGAKCVSRELPVTVNPLRRRASLHLWWCDLAPSSPTPSVTSGPPRSPPLPRGAPHPPPQVWPGVPLASRSKIAVPYNTNWGPSLLWPSSRYHQKYHYRHLIRILGDQAWIAFTPPPSSTMLTCMESNSSWTRVLSTNGPKADF